MTRGRDGIRRKEPNICPLGCSSLENKPERCRASLVRKKQEDMTSMGVVLAKNLINTTKEGGGAGVELGAEDRPRKRGGERSRRKRAWSATQWGVLTRGVITAEKKPSAWKLTFLSNGIKKMEHRRDRNTTTEEKIRGEKGDTNVPAERSMTMRVLYK